MAEAFLGLSAQDRHDALGVAAYRSGRSAHLLEKMSGWSGRLPPSMPRHSVSIWC
jgi:hypothetical protein